MSDDAHLESSSIVVNADAWTGQRTGECVEELTERFSEFDAYVSEKAPYAFPDTVAAFITAHAGDEWIDAEFNMIQTSRGEGTAVLSVDLQIYRYTDSQFGKVALIRDDHPHQRPGPVTAYYDTVIEGSDWCIVAVEIICPEGHGWTVYGSDLQDMQGSSVKPADVFGPNGIVTIDEDPESPTFNESRIVCPCGEHCTVNLPQL